MWTTKKENIDNDKHDIYIVSVYGLGIMYNYVPKEASTEFNEKIKREENIAKIKFLMSEIGNSEYRLLLFKIFFDFEDIDHDDDEIQKVFRESFMDAIIKNDVELCKLLYEYCPFVKNCDVRSLIMYNMRYGGTRKYREMNNYLKSTMIT